QRVARGVALVVQSNAMALNLLRQRRGLPIAYLISVGEQSTVGAVSILRALLQDERVSAIGLQVDDTLDVAQLERAMALAHTRRVPVVGLDPGTLQLTATRDAAAEPSASGSLPHAQLMTALLQRLGIVRVRGETRLIETLKLLHTTGPLSGPRVGVLAACHEDAMALHVSASESGLAPGQWHDEPHRRLAWALESASDALDPPRVETSLKLAGAVLDGHFRQLDEADVSSADGARAVAVLALSQYDDGDCLEPACDGGLARVYTRLLDRFVDQARAQGRPAVVVAGQRDALPEALALRLMTDGVVPLIGTEPACEALAAAVRLGRHEPGEPLLLPEMLRRRSDARPAGERRVSPGIRGVREMLTPDEARLKSQLANFGVRIPPGIVCEDANAAIAALEQFAGPVSLKPVGLAAALSEVGSWQGLQDKTEVRRAFQSLARQGAQVLVEPVYAQPLLELRLGLRRDARLGAYMLIGTRDASGRQAAPPGIVLLRATRAQIERAVAELCLLDPPDAWPAFADQVALRPRATTVVGEDETPTPLSEERLAALRASVIGSVVDSALALQRYAMENMERIDALDIDPLVVRVEDLCAYAMNVKVRLSRGQRGARRG
ncbi:MAG: hypothetical protein KDK91_26615, partial [Gammaproteobacteria bacterium]|nr:hypothetical protein [Gammaproteobacteria bacterium]